jgi:hypothetical protein
MCPLKQNNHTVQHPQQEIFLFVLQLTQLIFEENGIACSNVASLISKWSSSGLD